MLIYKQIALLCRDIAILQPGYGVLRIVGEIVVCHHIEQYRLGPLYNNNLLRLRLLAGEEGERHSQSAKEKPYVHASCYHILQR